ncbi:MAG: HNH endonuclease [Hyphomicrobium sp.]|jgi:hypothetical protein
MSKVTAARLRELIHYDPTTGVFTWLVSTSNRAQVGSRAGWIVTKKNGKYRRISIDGRTYEEGVLALLYMTGFYPTKRIDHKDTDGTSNRWANLREAEVWENNVNTKTSKPSKLGVRGVRYYSGRRKPFHARLHWAGKLHSLGYHETVEQAKAAHDAKAKELWGGFGRFEPLPSPPKKEG